MVRGVVPTLRATSPMRMPAEERGVGEEPDPGTCEELLCMAFSACGGGDGGGGPIASAIDSIAMVEIMPAPARARGGVAGSHQAHSRPEQGGCGEHPQSDVHVGDEGVELVLGEAAGEA